MTVRPPGDRPITAPGVIVPPQYAHACSTDSGFAALFIDPWPLSSALVPTTLDVGTVRRLLDASCMAEVTGLTGQGPELDPRVVRALRACPGESLAATAAASGFADQAHLARTSRTMLGRTPASLR
ncbi:hypothetical protein ACFYTC_35685 [Actinomadura nitritigenes]|uniref:hypothetical protein n=1 Tax=Actinomadura nitritigenes TaxID=134602 RepID=UPI0036A3DF70